MRMLTKMAFAGQRLLGVYTFLFLTAQIVSDLSLPAYTAVVEGNALAAQDGKLRWAVGVRNVQVVRSALDNPIRSRQRHPGETSISGAVT